MVVIGIDFGNDSCIISVIRNGLETVTNDFNEPKTPSMVAFSTRKHEIGVAAKKQWATNIDHTIFDFKNLLDLQFKKKRLFDILATKRYSADATLEILFKNQTLQFNPAQILIMLFAKIKGDVNDFLRPKAVTGCVLAVPSYFNEKERNMLLVAAGIAGFDCHFVIKETTAVAINYSFYKKFQTPINVMFIDFGHSSIQISVCKFNAKQLEVIAEVSDLIGGRDFDELLTDYIMKTFHIPATYRKNRVFCVQLLQEVEDLKKKMTSNADVLPINLRHLLKDEYISVSMNRATMEEICSSLFNKIEELLYKCLKEANMKIDEIHSIEMVGGSSRVPAVKRLVEKVFGKSPVATMNQDEAVSRGCLLRSVVGVKRRGFKINEKPFVKTSTCDSDANVRVFQVHKNLRCAVTDTLDITEREVKEYLKIERNLAQSDIEELERQNARNNLHTLLSKQMNKSDGILANSDPQKLKQMNDLMLWEDGTKEQYEKSLAEWIRYVKDLIYKVDRDGAQMESRSLPTTSNTDSNYPATQKGPMSSSDQKSVKKSRLEKIVKVTSTSQSLNYRAKPTIMQQRKDFYSRNPTNTNQNVNSTEKLLNKSRQSINQHCKQSRSSRNSNMLDNELKDPSKRERKLCCIL